MRSRSTTRCKRHEGTVTVWIDGIAASAASYIAMAGDEIVMPENAFLMIHDPAGLVMGTAEDMRAMAEALDKVKGSLSRATPRNPAERPEEVAGLMAAETWFDASDAVAQGFADRTGRARAHRRALRHWPLPQRAAGANRGCRSGSGDGAEIGQRTRRPTATLKAIS
jgi:ATP-dependent protease ClpP protease subunit